MRLHFTLIFGILFTCSVSGQETSNVKGSWIDTEVEVNWSKKVDFEVKQSTRFTNFIDQFAVSNTTFKVTYELADWLDVKGAYRYVARERKNRKFNRYQLALQASKKWNDIKFSWRSRFEYRKAIDRDSDVSRWRNRLTAGYKIKPIDISAKAFIEYWYEFDEPLNDFSKYRIGGSLSKEIINNLDLKLGYNYNSDLNQDEIELESNIVIGLTYKIKRAR